VAPLADRLAARTLELVDIPSESLHEAQIEAHVRSLVPGWLEPDAICDAAALYASPRRDGAPLVVLAAHYDTVPAQDNLPGRIDGATVHGLGSSDMKSGLAVALELVRDLDAAAAAAVDVALLLFGREELPQVFNPLPELFERSALLHEAGLVILLEPTAGTIQAGCLGNLNAHLLFRGVSGHSARPWLAENAIERAIEGLAPLIAHEPREAVMEGLSFWEVLAVTRLEAGIADNVIPDLALAHLNFRFAPDRSEDEAVAFLRGIVPDGAELEILGTAPAGSVAAGSPLVKGLLEAGAKGLEPKQAWTNVADFSVRGIDAVNFGPGDPAYAHRRDEHVHIDGLVHAYETLRRFVGA
jgi:succinyl-diaminopimelate desuccinylase